MVDTDADAAPPRSSLLTERLLLRPWEADDWPALHALWADPDAHRWSSFDPLSEEAAREMAHKVAEAAERGHPPHGLVVTLRSGGEVIGPVGSP